MIMANKIFSAGCKTPSEHRTLRKVVFHVEISPNRVYKALGLFRRLIKRSMPSKKHRHLRQKNEERTLTLDAIHKVSLMFQIVLSFIYIKVMENAGYLMSLMPLLVQAKRASDPELDCEFILTFKKNATISGFWVDPEADSSGDEDLEATGLCCCKTCLKSREMRDSNMSDSESENE